MEELIFKKILVPFDFDPTFECALKAAKDLSLLSGAKIIILSIIEPITVNNGIMGAYFYAPFENHHALILERREAILPFLSKYNIPVDRCEFRVMTEFYHSAIRKICKTERIDLIVTPDFHKSTFQRFLAAINPLALMRTIKTPVLVLNKCDGNFSLNKIVLPIRNVSNWFDKVPSTAAIAKLTNAFVYVVGMAEKSLSKKRIKIDERVWLCERYLDRMKLNYQTEHFYKNGDMHQELIFFSELNQVDLIAVSPPTHLCWLQSLVKLNLYTKIVTKTNIPVFGFTLS